MTSPRSERWLRARRLYESGSLSAAAAHCRALLLDQADDPLANWMLSAIHLRTGEPRKASQYAIAAYHQADRLAISDLLNVGMSLIESGEIRLARNLMLGINREDTARKRGFWGAARMLGLLELPEPAMQLLDAIDDPALQNPSVSHLRGSLLSVLGRPAEAAIAYEDAIRQMPQYAHAHLSLSQLHLAQGRNARIDRLRGLLRTPMPSPDHFAMLQYGLFNELDAEDDTSGAWEALMSGASVRRQMFPHDRRLESRIFDRIIEATTSESKHSSAPCQETLSAAPRPIFIVGMPRTGTTVMERILGNHPDIRACGELTAFVQQHQWVADRTWDGMFDERAASEQSQLDFDLLGTRYRHATSWRALDKAFFTDKAPGNFMSVGLILKALPDARIIHLRRGAMDACFSNLKVLFAPSAYAYSYDQADLAAHRYNYDRLMRHWDTVFPGRIVTIDYEDLVADPERYVREFLSGCGLDYRQGMTDLTTNSRSVSTQSRNQVREPIHQRNVGGWQRYADRLEPLRNRLADAR